MSDSEYESLTESDLSEGFLRRTRVQDDVDEVDDLELSDDLDADQLDSPGQGGTTARSAVDGDNAAHGESLQLLAPDLIEDPLGLGVVEEGSWVLREPPDGERLGGGISARSRASSLASRKGVRVRISDAAEKSGLAPIEGPGAHLHPFSSTFDPRKYLAKVHGSSTLDALRAGREHLTNELSERTSQMRDLVKDNFERFISCKNTINDVRRRIVSVKKKSARDDAGMGEPDSDMDGDDHGGVESLIGSIEQVHAEATSLFTEQIARQAQADRIRRVLTLMSRFQSLFSLPAAMRECAQREEYEQALREFRKARTLIEQANAPILHRVLDEGRKVVLEMEVQLLESLEVQSDSPDLLDRAVKQLQQVEESGGTTDALHQFLLKCSSEVKSSLRELARGGVESHASGDIDSKEANGAGWAGAPTREGENGESSTDGNTSGGDETPMHGPQACFETSHAMILLLRERLPRLRRLLPLVPLKGDASKTATGDALPSRKMTLKDAVKAAAKEAKGLERVVVTEVLEVFDVEMRYMLDIIFKQQEKQKTVDAMASYLEGIYGIVQALEDGAKYFSGENMPSASSTLTHLQSLAGSGFVRAFGKQLRDRIRSIDSTIAQTMPVPGVMNPYSPVWISPFPLHVRILLLEGMQRMKPLAAHTQAFPLVIAPLQIAVNTMVSTSDTFKDSKQWSKVGNPLRLLSDCHLMRVQVFPELQHQYKALWPSKQGTNPNESKEWESLITRLRSVEKALISTYAKAKLTSSQAVLQKWLKALVAGSEVLSGHVRYEVLEIMHLMVQVHSECYSYADCHLHVLVQAVLQAFLTTLKRALMEAVGGSAKAPTLGSVLQALFEMEYLKQVFTSYITDGLRTLLDTICSTLTDSLAEADRQELQPKLKHLKANSIPTVLKRTALNVRCFTGSV
mmetsp:Transcript_11664/g.42646  ORF Transcript_11664/g.42646 Transcript_11664/m.42646 type:complete len:914 (-) Transcript_11664:54-2795(-)